MSPTHDFRLRMFVASVMLLGCGPALVPEPNVHSDGSETQPEADVGLETDTGPEAGTKTGTSTDTSTDTGTGTDTDSSTETDSGTLPCDPDVCAQDCEWNYDECAQPMAGVCTDAGECQCVQVAPCPPCIDSECPPGTECSSDNGTCQVQCMGEIPPVIEPPGSCEIPEVNVPYPDFTHIEIDGIEVPRVDDCALDLQGWVWIDWWGIRLCEEACLAFEAAETVWIGWMIDCE